MKKEDFEKMVKIFDSKIKEVAKIFKPLITKKDINKLKLSEIKVIKENASRLKSEQDKIFSEFRHILGMIPLSMAQTSKLTHLFKEYSGFRRYIQYAADMSSIIDNIKNISERSSYTGLILLGNSKMYSDGTYDAYINKEDTKNTAVETKTEEIESSKTEENEPKVEETEPSKNEENVDTLKADTVDQVTPPYEMKFLKNQNQSIKIMCSKEDILSFENDIQNAYRNAGLEADKDKITKEILKNIANGFNLSSQFKFYDITFTKSVKKDGLFRAVVSKKKVPLLHAYLAARYLID